MGFLDSIKRGLGLVSQPLEQSTAPSPTQASLSEVLGRCTRVRILDLGMVGDEALGPRVLLDTNNEDDLRGLRECLRISDGAAGAGHCMCIGSQAIELFSEGRTLAVLSLHHARSLRWDAWAHDAQLVEAERLVSWLEAHGVADPKR